MVDIGCIRLFDPSLSNFVDLVLLRPFCGLGLAASRNVLDFRRDGVHGWPFSLIVSWTLTHIVSWLLPMDTRLTFFDD